MKIKLIFPSSLCNIFLFGIEASKCYFQNINIEGTYPEDLDYQVRIAKSKF